MSSGNYINKMSDYCEHCTYDVKKRTGPDSCPFNSLYWNFLHCNRDKLEGNGRLRNAYSTLDRMDPDKVAALNERAEEFLDAMPTAPVSDYI